MSDPLLMLPAVMGVEEAVAQVEFSNKKPGVV